MDEEEFYENVLSPVIKELAEWNERERLLEIRQRIDLAREHKLMGWVLHCAKCDCPVAHDSPNYLACYHTTRKIGEVLPDDWYLRNPG